MASATLGRHFVFSCLLIACIAIVLIWVGMDYCDLHYPNYPLQPSDRGYCSQDQSTIQIQSNLDVQPKDASCDVYEEVCAPIFEFSLTNRGGNTIRITKVDPGCGCTTAHLGKELLAPGETTALGVVYRATSILGQLPRRTITISTDEVDAESVSCSVGGVRRARFSIEPPSVQLGLVLSGTSSWQQVTVVAHGPGMQLMPEQIQSNNRWIAAKLLRRELLSDGGTQLVLNVGVDKDTPAGKLDGQVFIPRFQDDGIGPMIPVIAEVTAPLQVNPRRAFMGLLKPGMRVEREFELRLVNLPGLHTSHRNVRVQGFGECRAGVSVRTHADSSPKFYVAVDTSPIGPGKFDEKLIIRAKVDNDSYDLLLPISGMVIP